MEPCEDDVDLGVGVEASDNRRDVSEQGVREVGQGSRPSTTNPAWACGGMAGSLPVQSVA